MNELLDEYESLTNQLTDALISMDANRVSSLTFLQHTCIEQIQRRLQQEPEMKDAVVQRLKALKDVLERNELLLENAMKLTDGMIQEAVARTYVAFDQQG